MPKQEKPKSNIQKKIEQNQIILKAANSKPAIIFIDVCCPNESCYKKFIGKISTTDLGKIKCQNCNTILVRCEDIKEDED